MYCFILKHGNQIVEPAVAVVAYSKHFNSDVSTRFADPGIANEHVGSGEHARRVHVMGCTV